MNTEIMKLHQVSELIAGSKYIPKVPKEGWLYTIRTAIGMSVVTASMRAGVTKSAWISAEKREVLGTISLANFGKFLKALGCSFSYIPNTEHSLEDMLKNKATEFATKEILNVRSTMALENQSPKSSFSDSLIQNRAEDIIRNGNWKEIWQ